MDSETPNPTAINGHQSLPTLIAWLSTCLIASGVGGLLSDVANTLWLQIGSFGLVSAVGLEIRARMRTRIRWGRITRGLQIRCQRELQQVAADCIVIEATRRAVARVLKGALPGPLHGDPHRAEERRACNLPAECICLKDCSKAGADDATITRMGRLSNISTSGFAIELTEPLSPQRVVLSLVPADGRRIDILGDALWCDAHSDGSFTIGGRLIRAFDSEEES